MCEGGLNGARDYEAHAWLLGGILGAPVSSCKEEPQDGKASGPYVHTWYADDLADHDDGP